MTAGQNQGCDVMSLIAAPASGQTA
jgi:hypothetical protein